MVTNRKPRRRARLAVPKAPSPPLEVVHFPLEAHLVFPRRVTRGRTITRDADDAPSARAARQSAAPAHRPVTAAATTPRPAPALHARTRAPATTPRHGRDAGVTAPLRKFVDETGDPRVRFRGLGKNQSPRRTVGQPKPRASGHQGNWNSQGPSHWARTPGVSRPSIHPPELGTRSSVLPRDVESSMPSRTNPCRTPSRRPVTPVPPVTPAPYPPGSQNQGLSDSGSLCSQEVSAVSTAERLSAIRRDALAIAACVEELERLASRMHNEVLTSEVAF